MVQRSRWWMLTMLAVSIAALHAVTGASVQAAGRDKVVDIRGTVNCPAVPSCGGPVYLQLLVRADKIQRPERRPVNLTVVLDRSGSMGSQQKIENARAAVRALIDQLRREDFFSLVIYDDEVEVVCRSRRVGDKERLRQLVEEISPRGWTNLGGGLIEGIRQAERYAREDYVNRVILLSDGLANRGITDPSRLGALTARAARKGISLTTMGVGWDFNELLMVSLAEAGGGNYYFIESPRDLASVFRKEFSVMGEVVASATMIELRLDIDVRVRDVIGYSFHREGDRCEIPVGDLMAGEERSIIVELELPSGSGTRRLAAGKIVTGRSGSGSSFTTSVTYVEDPAAVERERDLNVQARADVAVSTRRVEEAMAALDEGDKATASARLEAARSTLEGSAALEAPGAAARFVKEQTERLENYRRTVSEEGRRAKKSIHYDNYRTQKKQE
jgi:Ca-activated chloride channel family protein